MLGGQTFSSATRRVTLKWLEAQVPKQVEAGPLLCDGQWGPGLSSAESNQATFKGNKAPALQSNPPSQEFITRLGLQLAPSEVHHKAAYVTWGTSTQGDTEPIQRVLMQNSRQDTLFGREGKSRWMAGYR